MSILEHLNPIKPLDKIETEESVASAAADDYAHRVLVSVDITANVIADGQQDETISSRAARDALEHKPLGELLSAGLDLFQTDHGAKAQAADIGRAEDVIKLEESVGDLNK